MTFEAPARGLIGFRSLLMTATRGTALLHQHHGGWIPWAGELPHRQTGTMVADRAGASSGYALDNLQLDTFELASIVLPQLESYSLASLVRHFGILQASQHRALPDAQVTRQLYMRLIERVEEIAAEKNVTAGQLALAWVLAQGDDVAPIPGTKRRGYLEENVAAVEVELSEEDLRRIDEVAPKGVAAGDRYADMSPVNL